MISIDLNAIEYKPQRLMQIQKMDNGIYDEDYQPYKDQVSLFQQSTKGYINLIQKTMDKKQSSKSIGKGHSHSKTFGSPMTIDLDNLKNMGYEGKFWFGNPS